MAREGVPLNVILCQLGHANAGITSIHLQWIDNAETIDAVRARHAPMIPAGAAYANRDRDRGPLLEAPGDEFSGWWQPPRLCGFGTFYAVSAYNVRHPGRGSGSGGQEHGRDAPGVASIPRNGTGRGAWTGRVWSPTRLQAG